MKRTHAVLLGLLLLQIVLIVVFRSPLTSATARTEPRPLFPELAAISPERMQIDGADDEQVTLVRQGDGWTIEELGGFPADNLKVTQVLEDLEAIQVRRPVVTRSSYHETFKVDAGNHEARLRIWDSAGEDPHVDLILGSSSNYRTTHARRGDANEVYEVQVAPYDVRPALASWIRKDLADDVGEVDRLELRNASGRFELELQDDRWSVASPAERQGEELNQEKVLDLLRTVTGLRLVDAAGRLDETTQGFTDPAATLALHWSAGETGGPGELTLQIGGKVTEQETQRYVTRSGSGFAGTIWESSLAGLLDDSLDDLRADAEGL